MLLNFEDIKNNKEILTYIKYSDYIFYNMGYREHSVSHALNTAQRAGFVLEQLKYSKRIQELAKIAGYMHDIGNIISNKSHAQSGAIIGAHILSNMNLDDERYNSDLFKIFGAIGSHEEKNILPPTEIAAAVILGDKTDVRYQRSRNAYNKDIHSKVISACKKSELEVSNGRKEITLKLEIDTDICSIMEYFEIFTSRTVFCSKATEVLKCKFCFYINGYRFL